MARLKNFIGGELVEAKGPETIDLVNPSTGEAYLEAPASNQADVDAAMAAAEGAFATWKRTTPCAISVSQSTSLPLPSSPHWVPTTTTFLPTVLAVALIMM